MLTSESQTYNSEASLWPKTAARRGIWSRAVK